MLQLAALVFSIFVVLALLADGKLPYKVKYQPILEEVGIDPVKFGAAKAECEKLSDKSEHENPVFAFQLDTPREKCLRELERSRFRVVGREFAGVEFELDYLIVFLLAFVVPVAVVRVPSWLWEGWRSDRRSSGGQ